jgi:hypothetical protein
MKRMSRARGTWHTKAHFGFSTWVKIKRESFDRRNSLNNSFIESGVVLVASQNATMCSKTTAEKTASKDNLLLCHLTTILAKDLVGHLNTCKSLSNAPQQSSRYANTRCSRRLGAPQLTPRWSNLYKYLSYLQ